MRRILEFIPAVFLILLLSFLIIHLSPGSPILQLIGPIASRNPQLINEYTIRFGLDKPLSIQLLDFFWNTLHGDFGISYYYMVPVMNIVLQKAPVTLFLVGSTMLFSTAIGTILGIVSARKPYSFRDNAITILTLTLASLPWFWLGELLVIVLSVYLGLFPTGGLISTDVNLQSLGGIANVLWHLTLPLMALSTYNLATVARQLRASLIRTMDYDFIKTARSKGLSDSKIIYRHALRNSISPVIVTAGLNAAYLFGAVMVVENIFSWPGMGELLYQSIFRRDYPVLMGVFFVSAIIVMLINLVADIIIALVDPRVGLR